MQLTIKAKGKGCEALSYLLAKNPNNLYDREEKGYRVRLFYTIVSEIETEATLFVTPDPIHLVRNNANTDITHYINDREFAVSSLFCSSIRSALGTALNGKPKEEYKHWVDYRFELELSFGPVATHLRDETIASLFEPLGYGVHIERGKADYSFELKQKSSAKFIHLQGKVTVQQALRHLFILIPVLDNYKHYYIDEKEIEKVERYGEGWLQHHPLRNFIVEQSLRFKELIKQFNLENSPDTKLETKSVKEELPPEPRVRLNDMRYEAIVKELDVLPAKEKIVDFGSGEGKLSVRLGFVDGVKEILSVEPSETAQLRAMERFEKAKENSGFLMPTPVWGSLFYYDENLRNKDIIILCEVIEHIDAYRLPRVFKTIFEQYEPKALIVTTPNKEYNTIYELEGKMRHADHRFEWARDEFLSWCENWTKEYPYCFTIKGIGDVHEQHGQPTQMCTFVRKDQE